MRRINKQAPVASFQQFKDKNPGADWNQDYSRHGCGGYASYQESRMTILLEEQQCLCGYTEVLINDERDCHLDHYRKRSMFPQLTFDWENVIAATNNEDFGAKYKDNKAKIQATDYPSFFNPVVDNVHEYFYYNQRGEIEPSPSLKDGALINKVKKTIEVFNLQDNSLVNRRKTIIAEIRACAELTTDELLSAFNWRGFTSVLYQELEI
jgi:uncharacterized protein (TIGR02646 family)